VVVEHLKTDGHRVRILARHPLDDSTVEWVRADLGHSSNLASAVEGVDAVIHAATHFPAAQRSSFRPLDFIRSPTDVDIDGTCALLAAAEEAGVEHSVHVSIVGLEHMARITRTRASSSRSRQPVLRSPREPKVPPARRACRRTSPLPLRRRGGSP
jgi:nucleoside-diphosphate-sugar epimerase